MKKLLRWALILILVGAVLGISAVGIAYLNFKAALPDVDTLHDVQMEVPLRVFSEDGKLLGIFG